MHVCFNSRNCVIRKVITWYRSTNLLSTFHMPMNFITHEISHVVISLSLSLSLSHTHTHFRNCAIASCVWNICIPQCMSDFLHTALWWRKHPGVPSGRQPLDQYEDPAGRASCQGTQHDRDKSLHQLVHPRKVSSLHIPYFTNGCRNRKLLWRVPAGAYAGR